MADTTKIFDKASLAEASYATFTNTSGSLVVLSKDRKQLGSDSN